MSKAELFRQLETLTPDELDEVAHRVAELQEPELSEEERLFLEQRFEHHQKNPQAVRDAQVVIAELKARFKK